MIKKYIFLLALTIFSANSIYASHIFGGNIAYTHISGDTFKITLTLYKDCSSIPNPATIEVKLKSDCHDSNITLYPAAITGIDITPTCPYFQSTPCNPLPNQPILVPQGVQQDNYEGIYVFPSGLSCKEFYFSYSNCCRASSVTYIQNPGNSNFYIQAFLNRSNIPGNRSPVFNNSVKLGMADTVNYFNFNAIDPDGDDLIYKLYHPHLDSAGNRVVYAPGFNHLYPISAHYPIEFDETTGILKVNPDGAQYSIIAVRVEEYRDGILLGYLEKELMVLIMHATNYSNPAPYISGVNNSNVNYIVAKPGDFIDFTVSASDTNPFQGLIMNWNEGIPGATFTIDTSGTTGNFKWTVDSTHIKFKPYIFTVHVQDDGCPLINDVTKAFKIYVVNDKVAEVWPGDADNNFHVSMYDLFPIGIAYGSTGPVRPNASVNWVAQPAADWSQVFDNTMNYKFVDANGDGTVDSADVAVVYQNYGAVHQKTHTPIGAEDGALKLNISNDTLWQGEHISADILLGNEDILIPNLYGIAFKINYNSNYIEDGSVKFTPYNWMGNAANNSLIYFEKEVAGGFEVALSKTNQKTISGYGKLGTLEFKIKNNIATGIPFDDLTFDFSGIKAITNNYIEIPVDAAITTVKIESTPIGVPDPGKTPVIQIYPNPAKDILKVEIEAGKFNQLTFFDIHGKLIFESHIEKGKAAINVKDLPAGVYIIKLKGVDGSISKKVIVE